MEQTGKKCEQCKNPIPVGHICMGFQEGTEVICARCIMRVNQIRNGMTEHNCETKGWRCYGNGPIVLEVERFRIPCAEGYPYIDVYGHSDTETVSIEVNYCPFCGVSETLFELARKNDQI